MVPGTGVLTSILASLWLVAGNSRYRKEIHKTTCYSNNDDLRSVYNFTIPDVHGGGKIDFDTYRGKQEPGANGTEILNILKYVRPGDLFEPNFPLTLKTEVNGENEHPLFTYLKANCPPVDDIFYTEAPGIYYEPMRNSDIRWNFEKFLINKEGKPVFRYPTKMDPSLLQKDINDQIKLTTRRHAPNFW